MVLALAVVMCACAGDKKENNKNEGMNTKTLVAYFSATGTTKAAAEKLAGMFQQDANRQQAAQANTINAQMRAAEIAARQQEAAQPSGLPSALDMAKLQGQQLSNAKASAELQRYLQGSDKPTKKNGWERRTIDVEGQKMDVFEPTNETLNEIAQTYGVAPQRDGGGWFVEVDGKKQYIQPEKS